MQREATHRGRSAFGRITRLVQRSPRQIDSVEQRLWGDCHHAPLLVRAAVGLSLLGSVCWLAIIWLLSDVIGHVFLEEATANDVRGLFILMLLLFIARAGFFWASEVVAQRAAGQVKHDMRDRLGRKLIALGPLYARRERTGDIVHTGVQGAEALDEYITQYQVARYLAGLVPAVVFILILILDPWTLPILLFTAPLLLILLALIGGRTRGLTQRREVELGWMSAHFLDVLQGLPTLKMFGRSKEQAESIEVMGRSHGSMTMDVLRTAFQTSFVLELGATAATALVAITVSVRLMDGLVPFNQALAVLLLTPEFFLPLRRLSLTYHAGSAGKAAAERLYAVLDEPERASVTIHTGPRVPKAMRLQFDHVSYAYDGGARPALRDFTLNVPSGQIIALRGPSGAGKTTVANLLLRFAEPDSGTILVDGNRLDAINPDTWRTHVAWVPQHPYFFQGSVADNLRIAKSDADMSDLIAAAHDAQADKFIAALPQGYHTKVGERGARLSGGQLQRLAIARAFLKDSPLLIFDEPTSHLDAESETSIREAMLKLMNGRTAIIIAHRLGLANHANVIVDVEYGRVATVAHAPPTVASASEARFLRVSQEGLPA